MLELLLNYRIKHKREVFDKSYIYDIYKKKFDASYSTVRRIISDLIADNIIAENYYGLYFIPNFDILTTLIKKDFNSSKGAIMIQLK